MPVDVYIFYTNLIGVVFFLGWPDCITCVRDNVEDCTLLYYVQWVATMYTNVALTQHVVDQWYGIP